MEVGDMVCGLETFMGPTLGPAAGISVSDLQHQTAMCARARRDSLAPGSGWGHGFASYLVCVLAPAHGHPAIDMRALSAQGPLAAHVAWQGCVHL